MSEVKKLRIPTAKNETIWLCTLQHINRITHAAGNQSLKSGSSDFNSGTQTTRSRWLRFLINTNMNSLIFYLRSESFILNRRRLRLQAKQKKYFNIVSKNYLVYAGVMISLWTKDTQPKNAVQRFLFELETEK